MHEAPSKQPRTAASGHSVAHWKWPVGSQVQLLEQPAGAGPPQETPAGQVAPCTQTVGLGGVGGGGQEMVH
jgi:hypothetical protein